MPHVDRHCQGKEGGKDDQVTNIAVPSARICQPPTRQGDQPGHVEHRPAGEGVPEGRPTWQFDLCIAQLGEIALVMSTTNTTKESPLFHKLQTAKGDQIVPDLRTVPRGTREKNFDLQKTKGARVPIGADRDSDSACHWVWCQPGRGLGGAGERYPSG